MKKNLLCLAVMTTAIAAAIWWHSRVPEPTVLAFRLGQTVEQVVKGSTLENLQNQFKAGGWEPWEENDSTWFDLTPKGKKRLYARMFEPGYMQWNDLRVPKMYSMIFRLKCSEGCWTREPPYLFLIDIGLGDDFHGWKPGDPMRWQRPENAVTGSSIP